MPHAASFRQHILSSKSIKVADIKRECERVLVLMLESICISSEEKRILLGIASVGSNTK